MKRVTVEGIASGETQNDKATEDAMLDSLLESAKESLELPVAYADEEAPKRFRVTIAVEEIK
jgi:hypothetical protein